MEPRLMRQAALLLPAKGSEDVSWALAKIEPPPGVWIRPSGDGVILPDPRVSWIIAAGLVTPRSVPSELVNRLLSGDWADENGWPVLYGIDASTGIWEYLSYGNCPELVTDLQFDWGYTEWFRSNVDPGSAEDFEDRIESLQRELSKLGTFRISADVSASEAARVTERLVRLHSRFYLSVRIILKAEPGRAFEGKAIWDVMMSLGLEWDGQCFHWRNRTGYGSGYHFSVSTSECRPFSAEEIATGGFEVSDLLFGYTFSRSCDPTAVFLAMSRAARYAMERLGGRIQASVGNSPLMDEETLTMALAELAGEMNDAGYPPGSEVACRLF